MLPVEWNAALAGGVHWRDAYGTVSKEARAFLAHTPFEDLSTAELVEHLYPRAYARGDGILARERIFKALKALATRELADCATRGISRKNRASKVIRPWLWHTPTTPNNEAEGGEDLNVKRLLAVAEQLEYPHGLINLAKELRELAATMETR